MLKYIPELTSVVMEEIPNKITLAIEISNCPCRCKGCHSPFLRDNVGVELTKECLDTLIKENFGINCLLFLGEGKDYKLIEEMAQFVRSKYNLSLALYSGRTQVEDSLFKVFDYIKIGPYIESLGPLNSPTTNQRLYYITHLGTAIHLPQDITSQFWS